MFLARPFAQAKFAVCLISCLFAVASQAQSLPAYEDQKFVDLRDLAKQPSGIGGLGGTARWLITAMETMPQLFVSERVRFSMTGPQGPTGTAVQDLSGREVFNIESEREHTRKNVILGAELEQIIEEQVDKVFSLKLILFVHDGQNSAYAASNGYYFKRMSIRVNWLNSPKENLSKWIEILGMDQEIPLNATKFQLNGDLLDRKVILEDKNFAITKVFPIAVGSVDLQTAYGMSGSVSLMTDEFPQGKIKKTSVIDKGPAGWNTRSRTYPSYFKGRPFIALFTSNNQYKEIGLHYQITDTLVRGFVSHGCIRVRDSDLYQLDAILNEGPHNELSANFVYDLRGFEQFTHPLPKKDVGYNAVVYSNLATEAKVECSTILSYNVKFAGPFHTIADGDCLTGVARDDRSVQPVIDYLKGLSFNPPMTQVTSRQHIPIMAQNGQQTEWESEGGGWRRGIFGRIFDGFGRKNSSQANAGKLAEADRNIRLLDQYLAICARPGQRQVSQQQCRQYPQMRADWIRYRRSLGR